MKTLVRCCLVITGLLLVVVPGAASLPAQATLSISLRVQENPLASLDPVQGLVQYQTLDEDPRDPQKWYTVTERILVSEGDRIRTDGVGLAYLTFFEGIQSEIGPSTLVVVSTLQLPAEENASFDISLDVLVGSALSSVDVVLDQGDRFEIHTPGATAVVRGTRWWTLVRPDGSASFGSERGTVDIIPQPRILPIAPAPAPGGQPLVPGQAVASVLALNEGTSLVANRFGVIENFFETFEPPPMPPRRFLVGRECGDGVCQPRESATCPFDCVDRATLTDCGDGLCDTGAGEDLLLCGADCGPFSGDQCGNNTCDPDESGLTCPGDCPADQYFSPFDPKLCGNQTCDMGESALTCPADCGRRTAAQQCGDGVCDPALGEDAGPSFCARDCDPAWDPANYAPVCGDNYCDAAAGETPNTCRVDCDPAWDWTRYLPICGDNYCDLSAGETPTDCAVDCTRPQRECSMPAQCGDQTCDPDSGENPVTCAPDCDPNWDWNAYALTCGDNFCDSCGGETADNCSVDCAGYVAACGDQLCDAQAGETAATCAADCYVARCGDQFCDANAGENARTCAADCYTPPAYTPRCGDQFCDANAGENAASCPADCATPVPDRTLPAPTSVCGDQFCDANAGEDPNSCPADCATPLPTEPALAVCGDQICDTAAGEVAASCPQDCYIPLCGDQFCDANADEDPNSCPADCAAVCGDRICSPNAGENANTCGGDCPAVCGDRICSPNAGEDKRSCPQDC